MNTVEVPIELLAEATVLAYHRQRPGRRVIVRVETEGGDAILEGRYLGTKRKPEWTYFPTRFDGYFAVIAPDMVSANSGDRSEQTRRYTLGDFCRMHGYELPGVEP